MNKYLKLLLVPLFLFVFFTVAKVDASAATKTWVGNDFASWSNPSNWSPSGVPSAGDDVIISGKVARLDQSTTINSLTLSGQGGSVDLPGTGGPYSINTSNITVNLDPDTENIGYTSLIHPSINSSIVNFNILNGSVSLLPNVKIGVSTGSPLSVKFDVAATGVMYDHSDYLGNSTSTIQKNGAGQLFLETPKTLNNSAGSANITGGFVQCANTTCLGTGKIELGNAASIGDIVLQIVDNQSETGTKTFSNIISVSTNGANKNIIRRPSNPFYNFYTNYHIISMDLVLSGITRAASNGNAKLYLDNQTDKKFTVSGSIQDLSSNKLSIEKIGTGKVVYTNASNTYTGTTTITEGILQIHGSNTTGTTITTGANGTLNLSNSSHIKSFNSGNIYNGGKIVPNSYDNYVDGDLTLTQAYGIRFWDPANGSYYRSNLTVNGNVNLTGASLIDWSDANLNSIGGQGPFTILNYTGTRTGTFNNLPNGAIFRVSDGHYLTVNYDDANKKVILNGATFDSPIAVHRFENKLNGLHHFTIDMNEVNYLKDSEYGQANWNYEGPKFFGAFAEQVVNTVPVYRFFNIYNGQHFLTVDVNEANFLRTSLYGTTNWQDEGIAFYMNSTAEGQMIPVYRFAHKVNGEHFYTIDENEANFLKTSEYGLTTWTYEGISMYTFDTFKVQTGGGE